MYLTCLPVYVYVYGSCPLSMSGGAVSNKEAASACLFSETRLLAGKSEDLN